MIYLDDKPLFDENILGKPKANQLFIQEANKLGLTIRLVEYRNWNKKQYDSLKTLVSNKWYSHKELSELLGFNQPTLSTLIKGWRKEGLIKVKLNPNDSRKRIYKIK